MSQKLVFSEICGGISNFILNTALTIKMESKNKGLEDDVPFQTGDFQVRLISKV